MKRTIISRFLPFALAFTFLATSVPMACATDSSTSQVANVLYELGLFAGISADETGLPSFGLERVPTRHEAVTMLVRLLGKEKEAVDGVWDTPFADVADWAKPYVGYAYAHGLTSGTSPTTFGGDTTINASQYLTFILRALGYQSEVDFQWDKAWELSDKIGLTSREYNELSTTFLRGDVAKISYDALKQSYKNRNVSLIQNLALCEAVKQGNTLDVLLSSYGGLEYYSEYPTLPRLENIDPLAVVELPSENKVKSYSEDSDYQYTYTYSDKNDVHNVASIYCNLLRQNGFSVKTETEADDVTVYRITSLSTQKTFELSINSYVEGQKWYLIISIPQSEALITVDSYDSHFVLSTSDLLLEEGKSAIVTATVAPHSEDTKVEWQLLSSANEKIEIEDLGTTLKDGKLIASAQITGKKAGDANIFVWLGGSDNPNSDLEVCHVLVNTSTQESPVMIKNMCGKMDSVGGVEWSFDLQNNSDKTIKYVTLSWGCYNAVQDLIRDTISLDSEVRLRVTGPIEPGKTKMWIRNSRKFYNSSYANYIRMNSVTVEYMDGVSEEFDVDYLTDYWYQDMSITTFEMALRGYVMLLNILE